MTTYRSRRLVASDLENAFRAVAVGRVRAHWCDPAWSEVWPDKPVEREMAFVCRRPWHRRILGMKGKVIALVPGQRVGLRLEHQSLVIAFHYELVRRGGEVSIDLTLDVEPRGGSTAEIALQTEGDERAYFQAEIDLHLDRLATFLEGGDPAEVEAHPSILVEPPAEWAEQRRRVAPMAFADLGIPLPRYAAPVGTTDRYIGRGRCQIARAPVEHAFVVDGLRGECSECGVPVYRALERESCPACEAPVRPLRGRRLLVAGLDAVRAGLAVFSYATELGHLGVNASVHPAPRRVFDHEAWTHVQRPRDLLRVLAATPPFRSWNDAPWLVHCGDSMVYEGQGRVEREEPRQHEVRADRPGGGEELRLSALPPVALIHAFRCPHCGLERSLRESPEDEA